MKNSKDNPKENFNNSIFLTYLMKKEDILILNQLVLSLEDSFDMLKKSYENKNVEKFNKSKKFILQAQKEISKILS